MAVRWIVDTSVWARREVPTMQRRLRDLLTTDEDSELVLSPAVLLELLRGPQGAAVGAERAALTAAMTTLVADARTFELAADAMERLAKHGPTAHRLPVPDLVTAALADQHRCGVVHADEHFASLAEHTGLSFPQHLIDVGGDGRAGGHPTAGRQRELRTELAQLLHQMPVTQAESFLKRVVQEARAAVGTGSGA